VHEGLHLPTVIDKVLTEPKTVMGRSSLERKMAEVYRQRRERGWIAEMSTKDSPLAGYSAASDPHCTVLENRRRFREMAQSGALDHRTALSLAQRIERRERSLAEREQREKAMAPSRARFKNPPVDWAPVYANIVVDRQASNPFAGENGEKDDTKGDVAAACERAAAKLERLWQLLCIPELHRAEFRARHMKTPSAAAYAALLSHLTEMYFAQKHVEGIVELLHRRALVRDRLGTVLAGRGSDGRVEENVDMLREEVRVLSEAARTEIVKWRELAPWNKEFWYQGKEVLSQLAGEDRPLVAALARGRTTTLPPRSASQLSVLRDGAFSSSRPSSGSSSGRWVANGALGSGHGGGEWGLPHDRPGSSLSQASASHDVSRLGSEFAARFLSRRGRGAGGDHAHGSGDAMPHPPLPRPGGPRGLPRPSSGASSSNMNLNLGFGPKSSGRGGLSAGGPISPTRASARALDGDHQPFSLARPPSSLSEYSEDGVSYASLANIAAKRVISNVKAVTSSIGNIQ
jgi:hypothetical protein